MSITEAQARRALRHADIPWDAEIDDPRESPWVVHDHRGMGGLAAAFATGCRSLRRAEDFFADLGLGAHRALGLGRGTPCDTTLYRLLAEQSPAGIEETVFAHVKSLISGKVVKNDRQKLGVLTFDGKGTWSRADGEKVEGARQSAYDAEGSSLQTFGALRAALTSSSSARVSARGSSARRRARRPRSASCSPRSATSVCMTALKACVLFGENHATEAGSVEECRGYRQLDAWPPALLGSWDEAGDEGDLVRQGVAVGAPALERAVLVPLSPRMSLLSASREQPLATGLPRASSRCLPDGSSSSSCAARPTAAGVAPMMRWRCPRTRTSGRGLVALAAAGTIAALVLLFKAALNPLKTRCRRR